MQEAKTGRPVALVTGAARGIGRGCAEALARAGFDLVLCDREGEEERRLLGEVSAVAVVVHADVADITRHEALIGTALERFGRLDCLVNNAGVGVLRRGDLLEVTPESYDRCQEVNTRAVFFLCQAAARAMLAQEAEEGRHRSIINITSSNAVAVSVARGEYCVSKAGASMVTRLYALRLAEQGIGVYEIRPGVIATSMTEPAKEFYDERIAQGLVPMGRWGYPADVAATAVAMAEGRLPYTVGQAISVDGGLIIPRF